MLRNKTSCETFKTRSTELEAQKQRFVDAGVDADNIILPYPSGNCGHLTRGEQKVRLQNEDIVSVYTTRLDELEQAGSDDFVMILGLNIYPILEPSSKVELKTCEEYKQESSFWEEERQKLVRSGIDRQNIILPYPSGECTEVLESGSVNRDDTKNYNSKL